MEKGVYEETKVFRLLLEKERNLSLDYLSKFKQFDERINILPLYGEYEKIYTEHMATPVGARIYFDLPLILLLSHPLCRMRIYKPYAIEYAWEQFYVTKLGILPVYSITQNNLTVVKLWGEEVEQIRETSVAEILKGGDVFIELRLGSRPIIYSSLNFILKQDSEMFKLGTELEDFCKKCIAYAYWPSPAKGFCASTHIIHSRNTLYGVIKAAKTLCTIERVSERYTTIDIMGRPLRVVDAEVRVLSKTDDRYFFNSLNVYIPVDILTDLDIESKIFLNAITIELRCGTSTFKLLNVVRDIGASYYELAYTLIGKLLTDKYYQNNYLTYICSEDELKEEYDYLISNVLPLIALPHTLSDVLPNVFTLAKKYLEPLFITHNNKIYFTNPLFVSFLLATDKLSLLREENRFQLIDFLILMEDIGKIDENEKVDTNIFFHRGAEPWKKDLGIRTVPHLVRLATKTRLLNLYKRIF